MPHYPTLSSSDVRKAAAACGFAACGIAPAEPISGERAAERAAAQRRGYFADMAYLARNEEKRLDPRLLVEGAQTVVSVAWAYPPRPDDAPPIAAYALVPDYHDTVKAALRHLGARILGEAWGESRCFVDTAPVDERYWAWRAGVGFIGRSGMLIIPRLGSRFFLGEIITPAAADAYDVPLTRDIHSHERCGACRRCIEACPGRALTDEGLDARRCLSYLTIEHRGPLPAETSGWMNAAPGTPLFYGCDRCTEVCPHNRQRLSQTPAHGGASAAAHDYAPAAYAHAGSAPDFWQQLSPEAYREMFRGSAVKRAKYEGLMRNIAAFYQQEKGEE